MLIVDSSVLIDLMADRHNPPTSWMIHHASIERYGITTLILCEVLQGVRTERQLGAIRQRLQQFEVYEAAGHELALASAANYRFLRALGITVRSTIDCLVATFCIQEGHRLLHNDRDFDAFEKHLGLQVIHPPAFPLH